MAGQRVTVKASILVEDDETFGGDEREHELEFGDVVVGSDDVPVALLNSRIGVGGEVRSELELFARRQDAVSVHIDGIARFFEGGSESTSDLEDSTVISLTVPLSQTVNHAFRLKNFETGEFGRSHDYAQYDLQFRNVPTGPDSIAARHSGLVLDVAGAVADAGAALIQWPSGGAANQRFALEDQGDGTVRIVAQHSGLVLDVAGAGSELGAPVVQWPWHGDANQRFRVEPVGVGFVRLVAAHSGLVLDVAGASHEPGAPIIQWAWTGGENQQWSL
jgi:Ricin-type beta-trefoil lectin domain-like